MSDSIRTAEATYGLIGHRTLTACLVVGGAARAIEFYKGAFGAEELAREYGPKGKISHAELKIGDSTLMLADEFPGMGARSPKAFGGSPAAIHIHVKDADAVIGRAVELGAKVKVRPVHLVSVGRYGGVTDPFGYDWLIGTEEEELSPAERHKRVTKFLRGLRKRRR